MTKRRTTIAIIAVAIAFGLASFIIPFEKNTTFWSAFLFGMISILAQLYFFKSAFEGSSSAKSRVYGYPIARIGVLYSSAQLIISFAQMGLSTYLPFWAGFTLDIVILILALIGCLGTETARSAVASLDATEAQQTTKMAHIVLITESLAAANKDLGLKHELTELVDKARFSDPVSSSNTADIEDEIEKTLNELKRMLDAGETKRTHKLREQSLSEIENRNRICRAHKQVR